MIDGKPSRTALAAASLRAAHQVIEGGAIFTDALALRLVGQDEHSVMQAHITSDQMRRPVRLCVAARSRAAEDALADAYAQGTRQAVILGAGLDSFAYRQTLGADLQVYEVDHPATQAWKRDCLAQAAIAIPPNAHHVPVDFETQAFLPALQRAGFDPARPCFVIWMGVIYYLTQAAIDATLGTLGNLPGGCAIIFDYLEPQQMMAQSMQSTMSDVRARVEAAGEALITFFPPAELHAQLARLGFAVVADDAMTTRAQHYMPSAGLPPDSGSAHILHARTAMPATGA